MKEMTVHEFNQEFGNNTWGYHKYEIATEEDIDTYVAKKHDGYTIPLFCHWEQRDEPFTMDQEKYTETIKIVKDENEKRKQQENKS